MKNKSNKNIQSAADEIKKSPIIGTFEGECADSNITNLNGMDITREVWEHTFSSDEYKQAIEMGWYLGYLGHPEDPNCMHFQDACIQMTEGHIDDNGKVYGKFNLIDTPVGRVVKTFIDAGVTFGISVRGAGDVIDNSVDPDTFVFRGFDLVSFPAFPESIPTFTAVAASTDADVRAKYQKVCAAVDKNINDIEDANALNVIKSQFAKQSDQYKAIEAREAELNKAVDIDEELEDINAEKVKCMTNLYLEAVEANKQLKAENNNLNNQLKTIEATAKRKIRALKRITSSQITDIQTESDASEKNVAELRKQNLKYKQKIDASAKLIKDKDSIISSLRLRVNETVNEASDAKNRTSNLDAANRKLKSDIKAAQKLVEEYQEAYANLYATATGVRLKNISVTCNTSVKELQSIISGTSTANISSVFVEPQPVEIIDEEGTESNAEDDLITI